MGSEEPIIPLNVDPPLHVKYRRLLDPYFAPKKMVALQPTVQQHTHDLIDTFVDRGSCDFSEEIAVPLPCSTFLSLFGLPLDELDALVRWKDIMIRPQSVEPDAEKALALQAATAKEIYERFGVEMADRRARPRMTSSHISPTPRSTASAHRQRGPAHLLPACCRPGSTP